MGYTIREITSGWSVIDYPEYFRDLETAIYNAKEWSKESRRSMFFIIDDLENVHDENGLLLYKCAVCGEYHHYNCGEHLVDSDWVCDECFERGREVGDISWDEDEIGITNHWIAER